MTTGGKRLSFDDGNYSRMDNTTLIVLLHIYLLHALRCVTKILLVTWRDVKSIFMESGRIAQAPTPENTYPLFKLSGNKRAIEYLIECKAKRVIIEKEIDNRLAVHGCSYEFIKFKLGLLDDAWLAPMIAELEKRGAPINHYPWNETREDVEDLVVNAIEELHQKIGGGYNIIPPKSRLPALPAELNMPVQDPPPWDRLYPIWFYSHVQDKIKQLLPAMEGVLEQAAPKKARNTVESHGRQIRRERDRRADLPVEDSEAIGELSSPEALIQQEEEEEKLQRAIAEVAAKYGPQVKQYIELQENHSKKEAAALVEIDESTGRRYTREIQITFKRLENSPANPTTSAIVRPYSKK